MCGVAGLFDFTGKLDLKSNKIEEALEFIKYRGPDESHYIEADDYFCGGAVRLSIEALEFGKQPISDSRYTIGFNGEIFNYKNLAKNYGLPSSSSTSEVQFLLEAWPLKGPSLFADLEGQFAIFIYDTINRKLVLGRDPYGIRPLFFSFTNKLFSF